MLAWYAWLRHARAGRGAWLALSVAAYAVAVSWYEVGFALPLLFLAVPDVPARRRLTRLLPFVLVAAAYLGWRLLVPPLRAIGPSARPWLFLFHQYLGFFAAQSLASGLRGALRVDPWAIAVVLCDGAWIAWLGRAWRRFDLERLPPGLGRLGAAALVVFLLPPLARGDGGGVAGRHLLLPSIGLALILLDLMRRWRVRRNPLLAAAALLLVVSQGNAWMQVVAAASTRPCTRPCANAARRCGRARGW